MQKIVLTQDAARRIVAAGSTSRNVCRQTLGASRRAEPASRVNDVRPARIIGEWSRNDAGLWTAQANFIVGDAVDASFEFDVAAPLAFESETAPTAADATAFVVWRGRWELLSNNVEYAAGTGIDITDNVIKNTGVTYINTATVAHKGTVRLNTDDFQSPTSAGIELKYPSRIIAGDGVTVSVQNSPRGQVVSCSPGIRFFKESLEATPVYVSRIVFNNPKMVYTEAGSDVARIRDYPQRQIKYVSYVSLNADGTLDVKYQTLDVVVPDDPMIA